MQDLIKKYENLIIDPEMQKMLNKPVEDSTGFNAGHEDFLKMLVDKLENGELNVYNPETLFNRAVYDKLPEHDQEQTDMTAVNLMSVIRQLESLWKIEKKATFQIQNLVETVFQMKLRFEEKHGDVFII